MASLLCSLTILRGGHNENTNSASMHNQDTKKIHYATGKDQEIHIILWNMWMKGSKLGRRVTCINYVDSITTNYIKLLLSDKTYFVHSDAIWFVYNHHSKPYTQRIFYKLNCNTSFPKKWLISKNQCLWTKTVMNVNGICNVSTATSTDQII